MHAHLREGVAQGEPHFLFVHPRRLNAPRCKRPSIHSILSSPKAPSNLVYFLFCRVGAATHFVQVEGKRLGRVDRPVREAKGKTMTTAPTESKRRRTKLQTELDVWLNSDANLQELTQLLQENRTVQSVSILYTCHSSALDERPASLVVGTATRTRTTTTSSIHDHNQDQDHEDTTISSTTDIRDESNTEDQESQLLEERSTNRQALMTLIKTLGCISSLRRVSITGPTSRNYAFPISALSCLLQSAIYCTKVSVGRLVVAGTEHDFDELAHVLECHSHLEEVYLNGSILFGGDLQLQSAQTKLLQAISSIPSLKAVTLNGVGITRFSPLSLTTTVLATQSLSRLCQSRRLTRLLIYDFSLNDDHLVAIQQYFGDDDTNHDDDADDDMLMRVNTPFMSSTCSTWGATTTTLREIRLSSCSLGIRGLKALSSIVRASQVSGLQVLHLWLKQLSSRAGGMGHESSNNHHNHYANTLHSLAAAVQTSDLRDFRMLAGSDTQQQMIDSHHPISSRSIQMAFCEALRNNYRMEYFSILCCSCPEHQAEIAFYLRLNKLGRRRLFGGNPFKRGDTEGRQDYEMRSIYTQKKEWIDVLVDARHDLSALYYFLSMNPSLCQIRS